MVTKTNRIRRGSAAVEAALVLPVLVLLLLGAVELTRGIMVQHSVQEAAQAACRLYTLKDLTQQDAEDIADLMMADANLSGYTVAFDPLTKDEIDVHMEPVTVTVSIPSDQVAWISPMFISGSTFAGRCTMPADLDDTAPVNGTPDTTTDDNVNDGNTRDEDDEGDSDDDDGGDD